MYTYDQLDHQLVQQRAHQFRDQVSRRIDGSLNEDEFRPLRLMNGLYLEMHAYMLRVAIPYGTLSSQQMRKLAHIAKEYDRDYGHFTTRQNIQYNWLELEQVPEVLDQLAQVNMHAIQSSGNCIRNVTADPYAGVARDELADPRPTAELIRQWSSLHPEFAYLPRKFKVAVNGAEEDRAAIKVHDIGIQLTRNDRGEAGYQIYVGGGLGRTPLVGVELKEFLPRSELLAYLEAVLRVYNIHGRRDNKYKARIKILTLELGIEELRRQVELEFRKTRENAPVTETRLAKIEAAFVAPEYEAIPADSPELERLLSEDQAFARWYNNNVRAHKVDGYSIVNVSLKPIGGAAGDASSKQMNALADIAEQFSLNEIRVSKNQNIVLPNVKKEELGQVWKLLYIYGLAEANTGLITDIVSCPGMDYCSLATARSIPIAQQLSKRFEDAERQEDIGSMSIKISGCINACGHHHIGQIGILGLEKKGEEYYQIVLGGDDSENASIGKITGPGFSKDEIVDAVERVVDQYVELRQPDELFADAYRRLGAAPFKEALYESH